ncbi:MAG: hypothetical protein VB878_20895 [Pirellulaceae bacterium]
MGRSAESQQFAWNPARPHKIVVRPEGTSKILDDRSVQFGGVATWRDVTVYFAFKKPVTVGKIRFELLPDKELDIWRSAAEVNFQRKHLIAVDRDCLFKLHDQYMRVGAFWKRWDEPPRATQVVDAILVGKQQMLTLASCHGFGCHSSAQMIEQTVLPAGEATRM